MILSIVLLYFEIRNSFLSTLKNNKKFDAEFWEKNTFAGMDTEKNNLRQYFHNK
jgi:hypothetical protein